jgi:hypothetical protein
MVFVDAGDFTGDDTWPGRRQTDCLIEGMGALEYRVVNLAQRELGPGYSAFLEIKGKAKFEFISANIVWQDTGDPIVPPTTVITVPLRAGAKAKSVRVGFIGLTRNNPAFLKEGADGRRIVTIDHLQAAAKHLPALRQKSDIVVALVAMDLESSRQLARGTKEIDLVLGGQGGHQTRTDDFPEDTKFGRARLMSIGDQGKALGEVRLVFDAARAIVSQQRNLINLSREWPDDPGLAGLMERTRTAINDYNREQAGGAGPFEPAREGVPAAAAPPAADPAPGPPAYTGSARCAPCHEAAFALWSESAHAHAFDILRQRQQDYNPLCVGCHTVGHQQPRGFVDATRTPDLVHVGCEACHGPSSLHPETIGAGYGKVGAGVCVTCHTRENSPDYNAAEYVPKILHWRVAGTTGP